MVIFHSYIGLPEVTPIAGWFMLENPKIPGIWDDLGAPFREPPCMYIMYRRLGFNDRLSTTIPIQILPGYFTPLKHAPTASERAWINRK